MPPAEKTFSSKDSSRIELEIFLFAQNVLGNMTLNMSEQIKLFILGPFATLIITSHRPLVAKRSNSVELSLNTLEILRGKP